MLRTLSAAVLVALVLGGWQAATTRAAEEVSPVKLTNANFDLALLQGPNCVTPAPAPTCVTPAPACTTPAPACTTPAPACCPAPCCPTPCITYRHRRGCHTVCCGCVQPEPIKMVLNVKNPCTCCPVEIPLCIPGCTTGEPAITTGTGIFCRQVITYTWANGFVAKIAFKHNGDVIVTTFGS